MLSFQKTVQILFVGDAKTFKIVNAMDLLEELDTEVQAAAASMSEEVLLLLFHKWDEDLVKQTFYDKVNLEDLKRHYVRLKLSLKSFKSAWERDNIPIPQERFISGTCRLDDLVKKARRNYYVAKRRIEGEHHDKCPCRGCKCIRGF